MCGRYTLRQKGTDIAKRFGVEVNGQMPLPDIHENYNVAPTQFMPVVVLGEHDRELRFMRWGIPRFIGPGKVKDVFNTRSDKAFGSWKKLVMTQRLLVPADGFYEFDKIIGPGKVAKQPYFIRPKESDIFAFAGIWNAWKEDNGEIVNTYSIMTTEPNQEMSRIHDRMPVILHEEDEAAWIEPSHNNDQNAIGALLHPYEDNGLEMTEVSRDVNNSRNNYPELIYPVTA